MKGEIITFFEAKERLNKYVEKIKKEIEEFNNKENDEIMDKIKMKESYVKFYKEKDKKLRWDLAPWKAFEKVMEVITKGAEKYGVDNWKLIESKVFEAAMIRHFVSYKKGERYDSQWNLTHLSHFVCNAIFLLWKEVVSINIEKNYIDHIKEKNNNNSSYGEFDFKKKRRIKKQ